MPQIVAIIFLWKIKPSERHLWKLAGNTKQKHTAVQSYKEYTFILSSSDMAENFIFGYQRYVLKHPWMKSFMQYESWRFFQFYFMPVNKARQKALKISSCPQFRYNTDCRNASVPYTSSPDCLKPVLKGPYLGVLGSCIPYAQSLSPFWLSQ